MSAKRTRLTFVSNSEMKLNEYRELLRMPNLLRQPMTKAESATANLDELVREKCEKALAFVKPPFFVEHTALAIDALGGWPGVTTESFLSKNSTAKLLAMLAAGDSRRAVARIAIGYLSAREDPVNVLEAQTVGRVSDTVRGANGFGWDEIFMPEGELRTYAEMTLSEKNETSMRRKVAESFLTLLVENSADYTSGGMELRPELTEAASNPSQGVVRVFVSYSHKDASFLGEDSLLGYLRGLENEGFRFWDDREINAGEIWEVRIREELERTDIALVLVSQAFLDSRFITNVEIKELLSERAKSGTVILPVILSACDWQSHPWLAATQFEPREGRTIRKNYRDKGRREELYLKIRNGLRELGRERNAKFEMRNAENVKEMRNAKSEMRKTGLDSESADRKFE